MKKSMIIVALTMCTMGSVIPVYADNTSGVSTDHAYIYSDNNSLMVGTTATLRFNLTNPLNSSSTYEISTSLGTLNNSGARIPLTPVNGTMPSVLLSSTKMGSAVLNVYENGTIIGTTTVTFTPGYLSKISIQSSTTNPVVGTPALFTVSATDSFGNPVADNQSGTSWTFETSNGQVYPVLGTTTASTGNSATVATHNGSAQVQVTSLTAGPATITISAAGPLSSDVLVNGLSNSSSVTLPITFALPQSVNANPIQDFVDIQSSTLTQQDSERELMMLGVLHGDTNHYYYPNSTMKRSEFSQVLAEYMGLGTIASELSGTKTKFVDVSADAWYDGAVAADSSLGYIQGDGTKYYPEKEISYAEVAQILLNNLGIATTGAWPNGAIATAQQNGLFNGIGTFSASQPVTRGDVAVMVRNALHTLPPKNQDGNSLRLLNPNKTLENQILGYIWYGDTTPAVVSGVPGSGTSMGNEIQVQLGGQALTLTVANNVALSGAASLNDLLNKNISYLTNSMGMVTYISVAN